MVPASAIAAIFSGVFISAAGPTLAAYAVAAIVNIGLAAVLGKILAPKAKQQSQDTKALKNIIRDNIAARRVIYGEAITGGPYAVLETTGGNNQYLRMIVILATHPIEDVLGVFIDDEYVNIAGNTNGDINQDTNDLDTNYRVNAGKFGTGDAVGLVRIIKNLGWGYADYKYQLTGGPAFESENDRERAVLIRDDMNTVWTQPASLTRDSEGVYTAEGYKLTNCAHVYISIKHHPDVWSGFPSLRFHVKGKRLYNPARDVGKTSYGATAPFNQTFNNPDSYKWSDNWALCCLDYLLNTSYGLGANVSAEKILEIDWAEAITAYNDSAEQVVTGYDGVSTTVDRYTINGVFETNSTPIATMESLLASGAGQLIYAQGAYKLRAGVYKAPASENNVINEDYIVSNLTIQTHFPRSQMFNKAAGVFTDCGYDRTIAASNDNKPLFEASDFELVDPLDSGNSNPYEVIDGEEIIKEFDYPFTIHEYEAKRLARIQLERVRKGLTLSFVGNLKMLQFNVGDNVYFEIFNNSKYANEVFFNRLGFDDQVQDQNTPLTTPFYKQFKIVDMQFTEEFNIAVTMLEEDEQIYDWNDGDANLIDHALISEIVFDDPTGEIIKPSFNVASPIPPIDEVISWPNLSLFIRWEAPSRGTLLNALDRAHIRSYNLEYGQITDPSAASSADRVTDWIKAGSFIVSDSSLDIQGPISLENVFVDEVTDFDFRIQAVLFNGRKSVWAYYSEDVGSDYSPSAPPTAEVSVPIAGAKTLIYDTQIQTSNPQDSGVYALKDGISYTITDYKTVDGIEMSSYDVNGKEDIRFLNALRVGDVVTYYISPKKWFKYKLTTGSPYYVKPLLFLTDNSPYDNAKLQFRNLQLIDYKDSDPTNVSNSLVGNVEFRFERDATVDTVVELLDLGFDNTIDLSLSQIPFWWTRNSVTSPDILDILPGAGEDGSNAVYFEANPDSSGSVLTLSSLYPFRNPGTDTKITLRYQSISGITLFNPFRIRYQYSHYPTESGVGASQGAYKLVDIPATGTGNWATFTAILPKEPGRFLSLVLELVGIIADNPPIDLLIDSITIEPANIGYGFDAVLSSNVATLIYEYSKYNIVNMNPATGNVTINLVSSLESGESGVFTVKTIQDATANRTITWQANGIGSRIKWAGGTQPTATTGANSEDLYTFKTVDGVNWIGSAVMDIQ